MFNCCKKKGEDKKGKRRLEDEELGDQYETKKDNIFGYTLKGYGKKKTECQDTHCIIEKFNGGNMTYLAVYDGHGQNGKIVIASTGIQNCQQLGTIHARRMR